MKRESTTYQQRVADQYVEYIRSEECDLSTHHGNAVFYSGNEGRNRWAAELKYANNGYSMIETTNGGSWLDKENLRDALGGPAADRVWDAASLKFAQTASGSVTCVITNAQLDRTFERVELPALLSNEKVTHINGIEKKELQYLYGDPKTAQERQYSFESVYARIKSEPLTIGWDGPKRESPTTTRSFEIPRSSGDKIRVDVTGLEKGERFHLDKLSKETKETLENCKASERISIDMKHERIKIQQEQPQQQNQTQQQTPVLTQSA